ncbi:DUF5011 domain-containing protein [Vagococcus sp. BWB3-3]|uniref:DUF5011 domain-containing protein n=1 Tax=Vagococcus allomyrinae TaxID=2794353 RepID=A0A940SVE2_9ENTE|nr:immunoglobulin-like domain-containing protein [Vagococcus allomyrinae]MBP1040243.1 DUF5011 domain-containing protein [Vagococcus allomyrinae]
MNDQSVLNQKKVILFIQMSLLIILSSLGITVYAEGINSNMEAAQMRLISGVSYTDASGNSNDIEIPTSSLVELSATVTTVTIKANGQTYSLKNIQELYLKNIVISNFASFSTNSVNKMVVDGVEFKRGTTFSNMQNLQTLIIRNSLFGSINYSLSVNSAPRLETLLIEKSELRSDLLIHSNKSLSEATVSESTLKNNAVQQNNKKGYRTNYVNTHFERTKLLRNISSGEAPADSDDIFFINPNNTPIGETKFNAMEPGKIFYEGADRQVKTIDVPAATPIVEVKEQAEAITVKLADGQNFVLAEVKEIYFRNVDIRTSISFTQKKLKLEKIQLVKCNVRNIDFANISTLKTIEINQSEFTQTSAYIRVRENKALEQFILQDSYLDGGGATGYVMIYGSPVLKQLIMNNDHISGYLLAKDIGAVTLEIGNSQFDDYITTLNTINGTATPQPVGYIPTIEATDHDHNKGEEFDGKLGVKAYDVEDGDLMSVLSIDTSKLNVDRNGTYPVTYSVTDSDGNTVTVTIQITVV